MHNYKQGQTYLQTKDTLINKGKGSIVKIQSCTLGGVSILYLKNTHTRMFGTWATYEYMDQSFKRLKGRLIKVLYE